MQTSSYIILQHWLGGRGVSHLFPLVVENWAVICIVPLYFAHDCLKKKKIGQGFCSCVKKGPPGCNVFLLSSSLIILLIYLQAQGIGEVRVTIYDLLSYNV